MDFGLALSLLGMTYSALSAERAKESWRWVFWFATSVVCALGVASKLA